MVDVPESALPNEWEAEVIIANLERPRSGWLHDYELAVARGDAWRADFALDHLLDFDRMIAKVEALAVPGGYDD